jgi:hypothetical protein
MEATATHAENGKITGVATDRGRIRTPRVLTIQAMMTILNKIGIPNLIQFHRR